MSPDEFPGGPVDLFDADDLASQALPYADVFNPQSLNKYGYTFNNPLRYTDPNGHCVDGISTWACVAAAVAVVAIVYAVHELVEKAKEKEKEITEAGDEMRRCNGDSTCDNQKAAENYNQTRQSATGEMVVRTAVTTDPLINAALKKQLRDLKEQQEAKKNADEKKKKKREAEERRKKQEEEKKKKEEGEPPETE